MKNNFNRDPIKLKKFPREGENGGIVYSKEDFDRKFNLIQVEIAKGHTIEEMMDKHHPYFIGSFNATSWLILKRRRMDKESNNLQYQRDLLEGLGLNFEKRKVISFPQGIEILKALKEQKPNIDLNKILKSKKPYMIGSFDAQRWLQATVLRYKNRSIPEKDAEKLRALGLDVSAIDKSRKDKFNHEIAYVKKAIAEGHKISEMLVSANGEDFIYDDFNITHFLNTKSRSNRNGTLAEYQKEELESLGYEFNNKVAAGKVSSVAEGVKLIKREIEKKRKAGKDFSISDIAIAKKEDGVYVGYNIGTFEATSWCEKVGKLLKENKLSKNEAKLVKDLFKDIKVKPAKTAAKKAAKKVTKKPTSLQSQKVKIEPVKQRKHAVEEKVEFEQDVDEKSFEALEQMMNAHPKLNINVIAKGMYDGETGNNEPIFAEDGTNLTELLQRQLALQSKGKLSPEREQALSSKGLEWLPKKRSRETTIEDI